MTSIVHAVFAPTPSWSRRADLQIFILHTAVGAAWVAVEFAFGLLFFSANIFLIMSQTTPTTNYSLWNKVNSAVEVLDWFAMWRYRRLNNKNLWSNGASLASLTQRTAYWHVCSLLFDQKKGLFLFLSIHPLLTLWIFRVLVQLKILKTTNLTVVHNNQSICCCVRSAFCPSGWWVDVSLSG